MECTVIRGSWEPYVYRLTDCSFVNEEDNFIGVTKHEKGKTDDDVAQVTAYCSTFNYIPSVLFEKFVNLSSLHLYCVKPITLMRESFKNCLNLKDLHLDQNKITKLPAEVFKECSNLESIRMVNNEISEIDDDAFVGLKKLTTLGLTSNKLTVLHLAPFQKIPQLKDFSFGYNQINAVHPKIFDVLSNLKKIHAVTNESVDMDVFSITNIAAEVTPKFKKCMENYESMFPVNN
ncbi:unnamed protein product [Diamesa tonsa]